MNTYIRDYNEAREIICFELLKEANKYILNTNTNVHYQYNGVQECVNPDYIERNSKEGRPRLFVKGKAPLELKYCDINDLRDLVEKELVWFKGQKDRKFLEDNIELITPYIGMHVETLFRSIGAHFYHRKDFMINNRSYYEQNPVEFETAVKQIKLYNNYKKAFEKIDHIDLEGSYSMLTTKQKVEYFDILSRKKDSREAWCISKAFDLAAECGIEIPIIKEHWNSTANLTELLVSRGERNILFFSNSTIGCAEFYHLLVVGWQLKELRTYINKKLGLGKKEKVFYLEYSSEAPRIVECN